MDHHEERHQHHRQERERRIEHEKEAEREWQREPRRIHPAWFLVAGVVFVVLVVLGWTSLF
jgi:hypothetical protein